MLTLETFLFIKVVTLLRGRGVSTRTAFMATLCLLNNQRFFYVLSLEFYNSESIVIDSLLIDST